MIKQRIKPNYSLNDSRIISNKNILIIIFLILIHLHIVIIRVINNEITVCQYIPFTA